MGAKLIKIVIIGYIDEKHPTGPSNVVSSLVKGLKELDIEYTFLNAYTQKVKDKLHFYIGLVELLFSRNMSINVHTWGFKIPLLVYAISRFNKKNNYFLTIHGILSHENNLNGIKTNWLSLKLERLLYEGMPNIICVSNYAKDIFLKLFNHNNNVFVVSNGLPLLSKCYVEKNGFSFVYAGGYSNLKGPVDCVKIFKEIHEVLPKATLTMCGPVVDESLFNRVKETVQTSNLNNCVFIEQKLTKKELINTYESATFVLAPSSFDTFNMTVLEAMNTGCIPIVSSDCGIKDILNNECGIVYRNYVDVINWIKNINIKEESNRSFEISIKNTYLEMAEKYKEVLEGDYE